MSQNYIIINEDKKEYLNPHIFDDSAVFEGFGYGRDATLTGLTFLITNRHENGRGGGDWGIEGDLMGHWSRDRIRIIGDEQSKDLFNKVLKEWADISSDILLILIQNSYIRVRQEKGLVSIEERVNNGAILDLH